MKKMIFAIALAVTATACTNKAEMERLQKQNDSLRQVSALKDSSMTLIATTMADIQTNLNTIKQKEGLIAVSINDGAENNQNQIDADINAIYSLLVENKKKVANLQAQLRKATSKNEEFEKLIAVLEKQIDEQNQQIEKLTAMLNEKDIEIGFLNNAVIRLSTSVDSLATVSAETQQNLQQATDNLQTAYYLIATKDKLKSWGVLSSDGLFSKKVLSGDVDNSMFVKVNTTEFEQIELNSKKVKILTNHSAQSYTLEEDEDGLKKIVIKDKEAFWQVSKYLVVQVK